VQLWSETWVLICDTSAAHEAFSVHDLQAKYKVIFGIAFLLGRAWSFILYLLKYPVQQF